MSHYDDRKPASDRRGVPGQSPEPELAPGKQSLTAPPLHGHAPSGAIAPGKQTLVELIQPVQRRQGAAHEAALHSSTVEREWSGWIQRVGGRKPPDGASTHAAAAQGVATPAASLPFADQIQRAFGRHDVSSVQAHTGPDAAASARAMGADAYATGDHVVLGHGTDLHTVAHEAAHVVQQRAGVQLKGGVGAAGDPYERHADAVADAVVAGRSAEGLLDNGIGGGGGGDTHAVQRKETPDDARLLEHQASLKGTDIEIPLLEGALLATRQEAVKRGLLTQASFSAGLALSQAMTQLQPTVAAKGPIDKGVQESAAVAAQRLFASLHHETVDDKNFRDLPAMDESPAVTSQNPYTNESRLTTGFLVWSRTRDVGSWFEKLPALIRQGEWEEAFRGYRCMIDGLDLWVADQLRAKGEGTPEAAAGDAQQYYAQLRTGLEAIADKHAKRLPAIFHPDPKTIASEKAAGRPVADAVPMNVYFWKDAKDGKFHLYDLTTPSRPHEQTIDGEPTAAMMSTFFEEVARYPEGNVQYTLPSGAGGVAPTTGKIKWYEWAGYAGMALAAVGLAVLTAGASIPATVCFAAGALAGGISAAGHLVDSARLGTATTTTVVLDLAQIVASFASFGAMSITVKIGSAATRSGYFVSFVGSAAVGDTVQLVALSKETVDQLEQLNRSAGTAEDRNRAASVLIAQLMVSTGLTALSVQGARNLRVPHGPPLELVEENGVNALRVVGERPLEPMSTALGLEHGGLTGGHQPVALDTSASTSAKIRARSGEPGAGVPATRPKEPTSQLHAGTSDPTAHAAPARGGSPGNHPETNLGRSLDGHTAHDLEVVLPPDLREVAVVRTSDLHGTDVVVRYRGGTLRIEIGPQATARHVGYHIPTARRLLQFRGPLGFARRLVDAARTKLRLTPGYGRAGFEGRAEVAKLLEIERELTALHGRLEQGAEVIEHGRALETGTIGTELASVQEQLEFEASRIDSYEPGKGFVAARQIPVYPVALDAITATETEGLRLYEVAFTARTKEGYTVPLGEGTVKLTHDGVPDGYPEFAIFNDAHFQGREHKVKLYPRVVDQGANTPPVGEGEVMPLTEYVISRFNTRYNARFGHAPEALGGILAYENKRNFQIQFAKFRHHLSETEAKAAAAREISYGKHRIAAGYSVLEVDIGPHETWEWLDVGDQRGKQLVPTKIRIIGRKP